ncbi:hypothetical protein CDG76_04045 [Nostoc sp. 'Peltigera membranacea cyanobiont' 210A]|nr:hypothetical protein CDG76_04045 [Nostoc sp. 'Peltigera membranacea cyanobiont' 210A]
MAGETALDASVAIRYLNGDAIAYGGKLRSCKSDSLAKYRPAITCCCKTVVWSRNVSFTPP